MSVESIRIVTCDVCHHATFTGTPADQYASGWRRVGYVPKVDRCPACRERIGKRARKRVTVLVPVMPARRKAAYGSAAYMSPQRHRAAIDGIRAEV